MSIILLQSSAAPSSPWSAGALGLGALLVIYAWLEASARTGRTVGKIVKIERGEGGSGEHDSDYPVISFRVNNKKYSFAPRLVIIGEASRKRIGAEVPVAYRPDKPQDAEIAVWYRLYLAPIVLTLLYAVALHFTISR